MAYLRIAENMLGLFPDLEPAGFAVGNIAPNSGIPDEKWEKFTTPPEVTHFANFPCVYRKLADMVFYRRYLLLLRGRGDIAPVSFRIGHFFHLIADNLWSAKIAELTLQCFSVKFTEENDFIWEVKKDWYGLDHIYIRDHPNSLLWRIFLKARPETGELDFLPSRLFVSELSTSKRTINALTSMYKKRIIVLTSTFLTRRWIVP